MIEWIVLDWVGLDERARFACAWPSEVFMILMNFSFLYCYCCGLYIVQ
jgi:hypothetical protein